MSDAPPMVDVGMIAATKGPGLAPALSAGYQLGKQLAAFLKVPFLEVNHMV
jgi:tRNA A37 threonylcarbamoyltransferase TsaD